jgi:hypothetical protein
MNGMEFMSKMFHGSYSTCLVTEGNPSGRQTTPAHVEVCISVSLFREKNI